ncbi:Peptide chain release factor [Dirofilaria immitis]
MRFDGKLLVAAPPDGRALWVRHDGSSINLMASTYFIPAIMVLPVDDCFEVRVLRIDRKAKRIYVRPLRNDNQYDQLNAILSAAATDDSVDSCYHAVPQSLNMSTVYMARTEKGYRRVVLLKKEKKANYPMYGIDHGEVYDISANDICELLPSLRDIPPLCLCIILESCCNTSKCEEFSLLEKEAICIVKICNEFPSNYPQRAKEMYPPAIMSQIYKNDEHGKFVEITCTMKVINKILEAPLIPVTDEVRFSRIVESTVIPASVIAESVAYRKVSFQACSTNISGGNSSGMPRRRCRALVVKSASVPAITRDPSLPFMFQKFSVSLPAHLTARVTERVDYDTYLMRDSEILNDLKKRMVAVATPLKSRLCLDRGICCIARLIRPARLNSSTFEPQAYRAIASHYRPDDNTCEVLLVDFGQTIVCSTSDLFELHDQPVEVLEKPIASFRCRVKRFSPSKKNGNKGIRLLDENNYNICLTLKCARDLYWAKVTLLGTDFILYCKKPRTFKEKDGKNIKERINIDASSHVKKMPMVDIVRKFEQRKEEIREEERLYEQEKLLRKEEENFTNESIRKEQELQLMALQMQLWDISAKLDMVASNNSNFMETACINQNSFSPQLQQNNCSGVPVYTTNDYNHSEVGYSNGSIAASLLQQQQHDIAVNQSWRQQWPSCFLTPQIPKIITPKNKCDGSYQQIISSNSVPSQMSYIPYTYVSNPANDCNFGTSKYNRNISKSPFYLNSKAKKRSVQSKATFPTSKTNSMISNSSTGCKISLSADSFWDSCHRKLEYGEPPHRTISDYCNIAKKQSEEISSHDIHDNFLGHSMNSVSQCTKNLPDISDRQLKLEQSGKAVLDASNVSHKSSIGKLIYTPDESADYNQLCTGTNSYEKQEMAEMIEIDCRKVTIVITDGQDFETLSIYKKEGGRQTKPITEYHLFVIERLDRFQFVPPEVQISPHLDDEFQTFPTYQIYHKLVSIIDGSELVVQRVGSDVDWPVFFVTLNPASQDITNECFDSLCPTHKLNANEISIGVLCLVQCGNLGRAKVRAIIERFNENIVHVRHIDDGHVEMIQLNELWSIENLSPNVRTQPALAVPCMLASLNEAESIGTISCQRNKIPGVGRLMRILFKEQRKSDGIWIVKLINGMNSDDGIE